MTNRCVGQPHRAPSGACAASPDGVPGIGGCLEVVPKEEGTSYVLRYRDLLWYDIVSRTTTPVHLMTRAADRLNELEPASTPGSWAVTNWTPALLFTAHPTQETRVVKHKEPRGASALPVETVERVIREELADLDKRTSAR